MQYQRIVLLILIGFNLSLFSQQQFQKKYESTNASRAYSVKTTTEGGYILAGSYDVSGLLSAEFYVIKLDVNGDTIWANTYGYGVDTTVNRDGAGNEAYDIIQTYDSGFLVVGEAHDSATGQSDAMAIKLSSNGNIIWSKNYGGPDSDYAYKTIQLPDSGFLLSGYTESHGMGIRNMYALRINKLGDTIWAKSYGGNAIDGAISMTKTDDGGFVMVGTTFSFGAGSADVYVVKIDGNGILKWSFAYGGSSNDFGNSIAQTSDKGYIVSGSTESFGFGQRDVYAIKIDSSGNLMWSKALGGIENESGKSVVELPNKDIAIMGNTRSFGNGFEDYYLIKMNPLGDTIMTRVYGGASIDFGESIRSTPDNGLILAGFTNSFNTYNFDVYLVKTDSLGNSNCHQGLTSTVIVNPATIKTTANTAVTLGTSTKPVTLIQGNTLTNPINTCNINSINEIDLTTKVSIFPNPTTQTFYIKIDEELLNDDSFITVIDINGKVLLNDILIENNKQIELFGLAKGIYFAKIETNLGTITKKIIKN